MYSWYRSQNSGRTIVDKYMIGVINVRVKSKEVKVKSPFGLDTPTVSYLYLIEVVVYILRSELGSFSVGNKG